MRALRVERRGEPVEALTLAEVASPQPGPGHVRVRVRAAALGLPDVLLCRGRYQLRPALPFTPGLEVAGEVVATADDVDAVVLGARVVGVPALPDGGLAEEAILPLRNAYEIPGDVSDVDAAATHIAGTTAHIGLHRRAGLRAGETLVVHAGAGGTGSAAIQLGHLAGARVIATAGGAERAAACRALGADVAIDHRREDFVQVVLDATDGHGADVVFDPVGGDTFDRSRRCIASEGRLLVVGFAGGGVQSIPANQVLVQNYSVVGLYVGAYSRGEENRRFMLGVHGELMALLAAGRLRAVVAREIALADAPGALEELRDRRVIGRVVVRP